MADRSEAPFDTITGSGKAAAGTGGAADAAPQSGEQAAELTAELSSAEIAGELLADDESPVAPTPRPVVRNGSGARSGVTIKRSSAAKAADRNPAAADPRTGTVADRTPKDGTVKDRTPKDGAPQGGTPKGGAPKSGAPQDKAPKGGTAKAGTPKDAAPKSGTPKSVTPKGGTPKTGGPTTGAQAAGTPKAEAPTTGTATTASPTTGTPTAATPKTGAPKTGAPKTGAPKTGAPKTGAPKDTTPKPGDPADGTPASRPVPDEATLTLLTPPTPKAGGTAATKGPTAKGAAKSSAPAATPPVEPVPLLPVPVRHSGDRIANRYRLEECLTQGGVFTSWRAVDEKLRRAVGIHLLAAGHQRSRSAVAAARQAALLGDPRFVQVLDAVEDDELVYIIREWLPDATDLGTLLADGPLEPYEAFQMVRQVSNALAAAHRKGLSHLRLTPACVLRSDTGQYRINGLAMEAALHGLEAGDRAEAELADTQAVGAMLFAALTHRWPYPDDRHGLQGMPRAVGVVPPEQVKAGVHRGLSDLCARALCDPPVRHLQRLTSPQELAKAVDKLPKIKQPEPEPLVLPEYPTTAYSGGSFPQRERVGVAAPPPRRPGVPLAPTPPPALPGRTGKALKWGISLVVLAAVGLGSWGTAQTMMDDKATPTTSTTPLPAGAGLNPKPPKPPQSLKLVGATEFSPLGVPINADEAPLTIDKKASTAWMTAEYDNYADFGNLPNRTDGSGIIVDLGKVEDVSGVKLTLPVSGQTLEVLAAPASATTAPTGKSSSFSQRIANSTVAGSTFDSPLLAHPVRTRYVLVHITNLPPELDNSSSYQGGISEIQVLGD